MALVRLINLSHITMAINDDTDVGTNILVPTSASSFRPCPLQEVIFNLCMVLG